MDLPFPLVFFTTLVDGREHQHFASTLPQPSLPSLWFIGESKCATSSIAKALTMHPRIVSTSAKDGESHLLDRHQYHSTHEALHKYAKLLAKATHGVGIGETNVKTNATSSFRRVVVAMEYTPEYIFEPDVPG